MIIAPLITSRSHLLEKGYRVVKYLFHAPNFHLVGRHDAMYKVHLSEMVDSNDAATH